MKSLAVLSLVATLALAQNVCQLFRTRLSEALTFIIILPSCRIRLFRRVSVRHARSFIPR